MDIARKIFNYLVLTLLISYGAWGLLIVLQRTSVIQWGTPISTILHLSGGFGPTIAGIVFGVEKKSWKNIREFLFSHKKGTWGILLIFSAAYTLLIALAMKETQMPYFTALFLLPILTLVGGGLEELGWRGVMQENIEKNMHFIPGTLIVGVVWAIWHIPLWLIEGAPQTQMPYLGFAISAVSLSFILAALYKGTKCVFACCVFHGVINTVMSIWVTKFNTVTYLLMAAVIVVSILVWMWFDRREKQRPTFETQGNPIQSS